MENVVAQVDAIATNRAVQSNDELLYLLFRFSTQTTLISSFS